MVLDGVLLADTHRGRHKKRKEEASELVDTRGDKKDAQWLVC